MRIIVVDNWYTRWRHGVIKGGAEQSALSVCKMLGADLYCVAEENLDSIDGVNVVHAAYDKCKEDADFNGVEAKAAKLLDFANLANHYDAVYCVATSAAHVSAVNKTLRRMGLGVVNYFHSTLYDFSFPRFGLVEQLWESHQCGAVNVCTSKSIVDQAIRMHLLKGKMLPDDLDPSILFSHHVPPSTLDHVDVRLPGGDPMSLSVMTRIHPEKNIEEMLDFLHAYRRLAPAASIKAAVVFDPKETELFNKTMSVFDDLKIDSIVDKPQRECFDFLGDCKTHLVASNTESYGIAPREMAVMGQAVVYIYREDRSHSLGENDIPMLKGITKSKKSKWRDNTQVMRSVVDFIERRPSDGHILAASKVFKDRLSSARIKKKYTDIFSSLRIEKRGMHLL